MERKIKNCKSLGFIFKNTILILVVICCGCGEETHKPGPPPRESKKEQPRIPKGSGGMDNRGNSVK